MIMNVVQSMFNIIDLTILKTFDTDGIAVGAVGVCGSLITLITNLVFGISTGAKFNFPVSGVTYWLNRIHHLFPVCIFPTKRKLDEKYPPPTSGSN